MPDIGYLNGRFSPLEEVSISPDDRGFLFGDGVYEVIRAYHGVPAFWEEHYTRLVRSAKEIRLPVNVSRSAFYDLLLSGLQQSGHQEGKIYIHMTRGVAPRDHVFPPSLPPTFFMSFREMLGVPAEWREEGVSVITLPDIRWDRCDIKSLNLLPNVLAKQEARDRQAFEAIFVRDGRLSEGATSNIFTVQNGVISTPERDHFVLSGVTLQQVVNLAQLKGKAVQFRSISLSELCQSDEVFIVGTTIEILPVIKVDDHPIRDGKPGPLTVVLQQQFSALVSSLPTL